MIKYYDLVEYVKKNHVDWNRDLFEVLRGFFEESTFNSSVVDKSSFPIFIEDSQEEPNSFQVVTNFKHPDGGEYTTDDLLNLFST